jgi:catechol 2,3-dioxygenase-like lactoylglutathione lyase family enzyme
VGGTSLELIETQVGSTHHREHVDSRGAGLHHIAFWVHDLATELAKIDRLGLELVMSPSSLHPALRGRPVSAFLGVGRGSVAIPEFFAFLDSVEETAHFGLELLDAKFAADYRALNGDAPFYPGELP